MIDDTIHDMRAVSHLISLLENAGFGHGPVPFKQILQRLDSHLCEPIFRQFYLAAMGLGEFKLKPPRIIDILGRKYWVDRCDHGDVIPKTREFVGGGYRYLGDWMIFSDQRRFDLRRARLLNPFSRSKLEKMTLDYALQRLCLHRYSFGTVWQMHWFYRNPELLPAKWRKILNVGGRIIFPAVELYNDRDGSPVEEMTKHYPFLTGKPFRGVLQHSEELCPNDSLKLGKDFIALLPRFTPDRSVRRIARRS